MNKEIPFFCLHCGQKIEAEPEMAGRKIECQKCKNIIIIPYVTKEQPVWVNILLCFIALIFLPLSFIVLKMFREWWWLAFVGLFVSIIGAIIFYGDKYSEFKFIAPLHTIATHKKKWTPLSIVIIVTLFITLTTRSCARHGTEEILIGVIPEFVLTMIFCSVCAGGLSWIISNVYEISEKKRIEANNMFSTLLLICLIVYNIASLIYSDTGSTKSLIELIVVKMGLFKEGLE